MIDNVLNILREIAEIIAAQEDHRLVFSGAVEVLARQLEVDVCSIYAYDEEDGMLRLIATHGLRSDSVGVVGMRPGEGLTGHCFETREIINVDDANQHPHFKFFDATGEERFKAMLSVPLTVGGRCLGVLNIQSVRAGRFPHPVMDMVKSLSTQLANLILNAKMLDKLAGGEPATIREDEGRGQVLLKGVAANAGIAIGKARIFESRDYFDSIRHENHQGLEPELELLDQVIETTKNKTIELERRALSMISEMDASIFNVHLMFLDDRALIEGIRREIRDEGHSLEFSISLVYKKYEKKLSRLNDQAFRDKVMDLKDTMLRLLETTRHSRAGGMKRDESDRNHDGNFIVVAEEILPSDLIRLPSENLIGIVCEKGGATSHVAILAKALDFPALMAARGATGQTADGEEIILDANAELLYIRPGDEVRTRYRRAMETDQEVETNTPAGQARTADGTPVTVRANISLLCETVMLERYGADGVGLYRTEFLYMFRDYLPSEEDQYAVFSKIMRDSGAVAIRTLDVGGDKPLPYLEFPAEDNPALGFRGIRVLLANREIFKTHLRAILRAGVFGKLKIIFPMICGLNDLMEVKQVLAEVETELHAKNIAHTEDYKVGVMLEVPSAIFDLNEIIEVCDFVSIGSNDLIQYSFAADRGNEMVAGLYNGFNPIFIKILRHIGAEAANHPGKIITLCGEMASNPLALPLIIGAGIREVSVSPKQVPTVKKALGKFTIDECEALATEAAAMNNPESVLCLMREAFADKEH